MIRSSLYTFIDVALLLSSLSRHTNPSLFSARKKEGSSEYIDPAAAYPAHLAPNGLLFYTGNQFPEKYKNGAFIAFHGSWNRAPEPQAGYFVVFQPFKNGMPYGKWEIFADNFSGSPDKTAAGRADHRPCGLAQGPDGSLYVTDDRNGTIFKISYNKNDSEVKKIAVKPVNAKQTTTAKKKAASTTTTKTVATSKPVSKAAPVAKAGFIAGKTVYLQNCAACHQADDGGVSDLNPPLSKTGYVLGDKTRLINVVLKGLSQQLVDGEKYGNAMPPLNYLTDKQIADVLTFIRSSFGNKASAVTDQEVQQVRGKK